MILMSYLLAQRYTIWGWVAGIPHERLISYHRIHAWALYAVFFAHMVCMSVAMRTHIDGYPIVRQINSKMSIVRVNPQLGVAAFILWSWLMFTSFDFLRRKAWGMWYLNHFTFFPAVVLTLFHNRCVPCSRPFCCGVLVGCVCAPSDAAETCTSAARSCCRGLLRQLAFSTSMLASDFT